LNVLVVGGGAREHALVWSLSRSASIGTLSALPGNPGIAALARCHDGDVLDRERVAAVAREMSAHLVVIGPEAPLAAGLADELRAQGFAVFGPSRGAARLESSKIFAREFMQRHGVPSARFESFSTATEALLALEGAAYPCVVKADGLAAGKGAIVCRDRASAVSAVRRMLERREFGAAGERILVEEFLEGEEVSVLALTDGRRVVELCPAQDHKAVFDGDEGPNTGGMGAYAPWTGGGSEFLAEVRRRILVPVIEGMAREGTPMIGCLYAGLMATATGPRVIEFNCRFGDPETEVLLPLLRTDLASLLLSCAEGRLEETGLDIAQQAAVGVMVCAGGYPGAYTTGHEICGLEEAEALDDVVIFHAGTARGPRGELRTAGGRVVCATAVAATLSAARERAYEAADRVRFEGRHLRRDIGARPATLHRR